ncbi:MAG: ABC transporter permease [Chloroherpetonaceae bacterium]|nr:ABC transporter permease [Chloroherpetonaceae bacterium]MCS7212216.1 ABC transporter permease [Chloroherpetonaceae bacterium]MDW8019783.1 ABC transporter permease [Chloroherpetonaceae bacterium]MDW8465277.1 ABC transporter permease [Chloroherpetonaceae bacterium]
MQAALPKWVEWSKPLLAIFAAFGLSAVLIALIGQDPIEIYEKLFSRTLGTGYGIGQVLYKATPLVLTGLAVAIPYKAGLFNIGGEGQAMMGAFFCALVGASLSPSLPAWLAVSICLGVSALIGSLWAAIAGFLRARFGISEVIATIMLNFVAQAIVSYWLSQVALPGTTRTADIPDAAWLPRLSFLVATARSPLNAAIFLSVLLALLVHWLLARTRLGYELRAVGLNAEAAQYAGINAPFHIMFSMSAAGALAGLVAANYVLGYRHYYELGSTAGIGFLGIAVAMLANTNPLGILLSALLFGLLDYGGLTINADVPKEIFLIVQALVILFVIASQRLSDASLR